MKNLRKVLLLTALLFSSILVSAQNRGADDDSTRVGLGFNNSIPDELSDPNSAVIAPMYCPNQSVSWAVGANNCTGTANTANPGVSRTVTATGINTGSATFTCSAATNRFTGPNAGATCVAPPPPVLTLFFGFPQYFNLATSGAPAFCGKGLRQLNVSSTSFTISSVTARYFNGSPVLPNDFVIITKLTTGARGSVAYPSTETNLLPINAPVLIRQGDSFIVERSMNMPYGSCVGTGFGFGGVGNIEGRFGLSTGQIVVF